MADKTPRVEKKILPNGLTIYHEYDNSVEGVFIGAVIHAGSKHEQKPGVAHFLEHLILSNPIEAYHGSLKLNLVDGVGFVRANTEYGNTCYRFNSPADPAAFQEAIRFICAALFVAPLTNNIEVSRNELFEEMEVSSTTSATNLRYKHFEVLFPDSWLMRDPGFADTFEGVQALTHTDLVEFRDTWYCPQNTSIVVYGNISFEVVLRALSVQGGSGLGGVPVDRMKQIGFEPATGNKNAQKVSDVLQYRPLKGMHLLCPNSDEAAPEEGFPYALSITWAIPKTQSNDLFLASFLCRWVASTLLGHTFTCLGERQVYSARVNLEAVGDSMLVLSIVIPSFPWLREHQAYVFLDELLSEQTMNTMYSKVLRSFGCYPEKMMLSSYDIGCLFVELISQGVEPISFVSYLNTLQSLPKASMLVFKEKYIRPDNACVHVS
jgi:hypothetical protein